MESPKTRALLKKASYGVLNIVFSGLLKQISTRNNQRVHGPSHAMYLSKLAKKFQDYIKEREIVGVLFGHNQRLEVHTCSPTSVILVIGLTHSTMPIEVIKPILRSLLASLSFPPSIFSPSI